MKLAIYPFVTTCCLKRLVRDSASMLIWAYIRRVNEEHFVSMQTKVAQKHVGYIFFIDIRKSRMSTPVIPQMKMQNTAITTAIVRCQNLSARVRLMRLGTWTHSDRRRFGQYSGSQWNKQ